MSESNSKVTFVNWNWSVDVDSFKYISNVTILFDDDILYDAFRAQAQVALIFILYVSVCAKNLCLV